MRYAAEQLDTFARTFDADGFCVLPGHFERSRLRAWSDAFAPLLADHREREGKTKANPGSGRFYVTLPFERPWADLVERLAGPEPVMCQPATDTPVRGSDYQATHRDVPPLFPEWGRETPAFLGSSDPKSPFKCRKPPG